MALVWICCQSSCALHSVSLSLVKVLVGLEPMHDLAAMPKAGGGALLPSGLGGSPLWRDLQLQ